MAATRGLEIQRMRGFRNGALAVSAFCVLMVPWRLTGAPGPGPMHVLALHAAFWAVILAVYGMVLHRWRFRVHSAEGFAFGLQLIGMGVTTSQLWLYGRLQETASVLLVSLTSGAIFRRRSTLAIFQALLLTVWAGLAIRTGGWPQTASWIFDLVLAGLMAFALHFLLSRSTSAMARRIQRQHQLVRELREAMQNIQTLSGLIPICAHCKKIRNDDGFWEQVETYLRSRSEAEFTHGICPECAHAMLEEYRRSADPAQSRTL